MALEKQQTPLMAHNSAVYKTVDGVTYFKLKSEFEGDYTKHCGLLGEEIDENFYFLRGYDIESVRVDENRNLIIERVDKDYAPIVVKIGEELGNPDFKFDSNEGTLTVIFPDGTINKMEGFLVEGKDIRIATDSTFNGNGTMYNPLRLSPTEKTGTFAPANEYFDLTEGQTFPEGKGKGYRIVTKELIDNFGCLYPFSAVQSIQKALNDSNSQWRIPTKKDWDELLNACECNESRNHAKASSEWLGKDASVALKSFNLWNEETNNSGDSVKGQDILGLSIYPLGITPDRNEILNAKDSDAEGFGRIAGMWTSTLNDEGNAYVKIFGFNEGRVRQDTYGTGAKMSIRLVKDYTYSNYNEIENILGFPYPTKLVYGPKEDCPYVKIWTQINFYSEPQALKGIRSDEWNVVTDSDKGVKVVYFINEWDGVKWHKKPLENGDSIIIVERNGRPYHEWRIIENELIDTAESLVEEFEKDFAEVKENIAELSATTKELIQFSGWVVETINEFSAATEEHINRIDNTITEVSAITTTNIERIDNDVKSVSGTVDTVSAITTANIKRIDGDIVTLSGTVDTVSAITTANIERIDGDVMFVSGAVDTVSAITTVFSASTVEEIARLDKRVDNEAQARIDNDITPGTYVLSGDASSEMVIPTYSDKVANVKIKVSDDFFNFGEF